jgi:hypothetical protein
MGSTLQIRKRVSRFAGPSPCFGPVVCFICSHSPHWVVRKTLIWLRLGSTAHNIRCRCPMHVKTRRNAARRFNERVAENESGEGAGHQTIGGCRLRNLCLALAGSPRKRSIRLEGSEHRETAASVKEGTPCGPKRWIWHECDKCRRTVAMRGRREGKQREGQSQHMVIGTRSFNTYTEGWP